MPAVLKLYFFGTILSVLAVLYGIVDSFGGLMYVQDHDYLLELENQTKTRSQTSPCSHRRGSAVNKHIGS